MFGHLKFVESDLAFGSRMCSRTEAVYGSHWSVLTARMPLIDSAVAVSQNTSRLVGLRSSATYDTHPRIKSFTSVR
jgi:hypothetical protein